MQGIVEGGRLIRDTSMQAYDSLRDSGMLQRREREVMLGVYRFFDGKDFTRKELAHAMGWEINRITGRVLTLIEKKFLDELETKRDGGHLLRIAGKQLELSLAA